MKTEHDKQQQDKLARQGLMQSNSNVVEMYIRDEPPVKEEEVPEQPKESTQDKKTERDENYS